MFRRRLELRQFPGILIIALMLPATAGAQYCWNASEGRFPNAGCPPWSLINTSSIAPMLGPDRLTIATTADAQLQFYSQANAELSLPPVWVIEARCRRVSGSTIWLERDPIGIGFQRSQSETNALQIGDNEIYLLAGDVIRGQTAAVLTSDAMHTYRIEVNGSAVSVYYDGLLKLTGSLFSNPNSAVGSRITWGEGTIKAFGVSEWEFVCHNGNAAPSSSVSIAPGPNSTEGTGGITPFDFTVNLSSPSSSVVTVNYQTTNGTATTVDNDYLPETQSISIPAGATSGTITIYAVADFKIEPNETFNVTITSVGCATLAPPVSATGTILDDDVDCIAYTYVNQWGTMGGGAGQFNAPQGAGIDAAGNVYVGDTVNNRIQKFTSTGGFITQWGSFGTGNGQFRAPTGVGIDAAGNVYVADTNNHRIQKFTSSGGYLTQWGGIGSGDGQLDSPFGVAPDAFGKVFVVDSGNERVQKFTNTGGYESQWGSLGNGNGQFSFPRTAAIDAAGNVFVADGFNNRIQKFTNAGVYVTQMGSFGSGDGQLMRPNDVAVDAYGSVYVADRNNNRIQKFSGTGAYVTQWGSLGSGDGQLNQPLGVKTDAAGSVYVVDQGNHRIQKFACTATAAVELPEVKPASRFLRFVTNPLLAGSAEIRFALDRSDDVEFRIFNISGQMMRSLSAVGLGAGEHSVAWDGMGDDGRTVRRGMYFVQARLGNNRVAGTERILVLK